MKQLSFRRKIRDIATQKKLLKYESVQQNNYFRKSFGIKNC